MKKNVPIQILVRIDSDGRQTPLIIYWGDQSYKVTAVVSCRNAARYGPESDVVEYHVMTGRVSHLLYHDTVHNGWFVKTGPEERIPFQEDLYGC